MGRGDREAAAHRQEERRGRRGGQERGERREPEEEALDRVEGELLGLPSCCYFCSSLVAIMLTLFETFEACVCNKTQYYVVTFIHMSVHNMMQQYTVAGIRTRYSLVCYEFSQFSLYRFLATVKPTFVVVDVLTLLLYFCRLFVVGGFLLAGGDIHVCVCVRFVAWV